MSDTVFIPQNRKGPLAGLVNEIINFSGSGDSTVINGIPGRKIQIHKLFILVGNASNLRFWSGPSSENVPKSGLLPFGGNGGLAFDGEEFPLETGSGKAFVISSSNAVQCGGWLTYRIV
jgi:hypothetical protein